LSRKEILKYATEHLRIDSDLLIVGGRLIRREVELIEVSIESIKKSLWKCESRCNPVISIRFWIKESSIEVGSIAIERISLSYRSIETLEEEWRESSNIVLGSREVSGREIIKPLWDDTLLFSEKPNKEESSMETTCKELGLFVMATWFLEMLYEIREALSDTQR
jgi:hypothetical protein